MTRRALDTKSTRLWFYRYKESMYYPVSIFALVILVCIGLVTKVILPQIDSWFSIQKEIAEKKKRIETINSNINFLQSMSDETLDTNVLAASLALPFEKDFGGVMQAIIISAVNSGVSLEDFGFQVGELANTPGKNQEQYFPIQFLIDINGEVDAVQVFIKEISEKLPIAEIKEWRSQGSSSELKVFFYHRAFPSISLEDAKPLIELSAEQLNLLKKLLAWRVPIDTGVPISAPDGAGGQFPF